ncbi:trna-specific adenosine-34 deaminase subunit tad3 [Diplodia corticola]|uniref:Trna-specific adenosine-34 deaminase subunit tad3 n=1 Tax=Diplodia corticola TaxID=236234 RepID=A0A1J9R9U8_9PEZI|nr:trna-specific adenosine-34 deaminase subunit tad3 [Diplodia corticola]OJD29211.1 trna-specific adenosine-34 deaminase subunit tad3 [Diplodia corticola]
MTTKQSAAGHPHDHVVEGLGITPLKGHLVPLKTKGEIRASNELINVYVVELPARSANAVLSILRSALPADTTATTDIQHLRRVIKPAFLPAPARALLSPNGAPPADPPSSSNGDETRLLLISPTTQIALPALSALLSAHPPFSSSNTSTDLPSPFPLTIHTLPVPALAPTSAPQAHSWSTTYWPVAYKHTNPFGPHPAFVARAAGEVAPRAGLWLALAARGAREAVGAGMTTAEAGVGAVVVERRLDGNGRQVEGERVVVVAGDGRGCGGEGGGGNVMAHAVMRAIGMVAMKRVRLEEAEAEAEAAGKDDDEGSGGGAGGRRGDDAEEEEEEEEEEKKKKEKPSRACCDPVESVFAVRPRTAVERALFDRDDNLAPSGYLCVDLEIYLTHEPCVMCSMAILHSRFNRVVFARRMPRSGGLTADERGLGHGLFWRPTELNWKFLCWEFVEDDGVGDSEGDREGDEIVVSDDINA